MSFKAGAKWAPIRVTVNYTPGELADNHFFTADQRMQVVEIIEVHSVAGAASSTLDIEKVPSGTAVASGTDLSTAPFALDSTVNTPVHHHESNALLSATETDLILDRGDSLAADVTGTVTSYEGCVTVILKPLPPFNSVY